MEKRETETFEWQNPGVPGNYGQVDQFSSDLPIRPEQPKNPGNKGKVAAVVVGAVALAVFGGAVIGWLPNGHHSQNAGSVQVEAEENKAPDGVVSSTTVDGQQYSVIEGDCALADKCQYSFNSTATGVTTPIAEGFSFYNFEMFDAMSGIVGFAPDSSGYNLKLTNDGGLGWQDIYLKMPEGWPTDAMFLQSAKTSGTPSQPVYEITLNYPSWADRSGEGVTFTSNDLGTTWVLKEKP